MKFKQSISTGVFSLAFSALLLAGCGSGGDLLADGGIIGTGSIVGTVPGTVIEAFGAGGEYHRTVSEVNNTGSHPFRLQNLPAGVGFYLVMIVNEGSDDEIVMPIAFPNDRGELFARITLEEGQEIDLGHIPLYLHCDEVAEFDPAGDCFRSGPFVLDQPFVLREEEGSRNPLRQMDADHDGWNDYDDNDHGYGHHGEGQYHDPQDHDDDRIPNFYDNDFRPGQNDLDADGINDDRDMNPGNMPAGHGTGQQMQWNG